MDLLGYRCNCTSVAQGLRVFEKNDWIGEVGRGQTAISVIVRQPEVQHKVRVQEFERWPESQRRTPAEVSVKGRQRENFLDISYRSKVGDDEKSVEMRGGKGRAPLLTPSSNRRFKRGPRPLWLGPHGYVHFAHLAQCEIEGGLHEAYLRNQRHGDGARLGFTLR